jgi:hypothetical protein
VIVAKPHRPGWQPSRLVVEFRNSEGKLHHDRLQMTATARASCTCGHVEFEAIGSPIMSAICYCDDCQESSRRIEALPNAPGVREPDGGTAYLLYRKDRFNCIKGDRLLQNLRLREKSPTKRVIASCCNSAMLLDFEKGHWVSVYRARFVNPPPPQMRIQTRFAPSGTEIPNDIPAYSAFPLKFMAKLMLARLDMLLRR